MSERHLDWDGVHNARDLGGLPAAGGRVTRRGALVRSDAPDRLTARGWAALEAHGIRTIVDLRNDDELTADRSPRPPSVTTVQLPLDGIEDTGFWDEWASGPQFGTPLYYRPFLDRFPRRTAAVVAAIAGARPGGVLFHCEGGRDRAGLVSILVLALAGVDRRDIAADHALSTERLRPRYAERGEDDQGPVLEAYLADMGTTAPDAVVRLLDGIDVEAHLRAAGLGADDLAALRARLLGPAPPTGAT